MDLNHNNKDDIDEVVDGLKAFIDGEYSLDQAVHNAADWLKGELAGLMEDTKKHIKDALTQARGTGDKPLGEVVADTLTILYREGHGVADEVVAEAKAVKSSVITALAGLTTPTAAK